MSKTYLPPAGKINCDYLIEKILSDIELVNKVLRKIKSFKYTALLIQQRQEYRNKLTFYKSYYKTK